MREQVLSHTKHLNKIKMNIAYIHIIHIYNNILLLEGKQMIQ